MLAFLISLHVLICIALILAVLIQSGRGAELGAAFGGMGQAMQARERGTVISKITNVLAAIFMLTSLGLALWYQDIPSASIFSESDPIEQSDPAHQPQQPQNDPASPPDRAQPTPNSPADTVPKSEQ